MYASAAESISIKKTSWNIYDMSKILIVTITYFEWKINILRVWSFSWFWADLIGAIAVIEKNMILTLYLLYRASIYWFETKFKIMTIFSHATESTESLQKLKYVGRKLCPYVWCHNLVGINRGNNKTIEFVKQH